jgi:hypothetical protein
LDPAIVADRDAVTRVFTSKEVLAAVKKKGIRLNSFKVLKPAPYLAFPLTAGGRPGRMARTGGRR